MDLLDIKILKLQLLQPSWEPIMFWNIAQHLNISGTRRTIAVPKINWISKYLNSNLYKYYGRLSDLDIFYICVENSLTTIRNQ